MWRPFSVGPPAKGNCETNGWGLAMITIVRAFLLGWRCATSHQGELMNELTMGGDGNRRVSLVSPENLFCSPVRCSIGAGE